MDDAERIRGKRVLVIEDGPTLTHGEMTYGAGVARRASATGRRRSSTRAPTRSGRSRRPSRSTRASGPCCRRWATARSRSRDLEATIARTPCDVVLIGTPIDLRRVIEIDKPALRVSYELQEIGEPDLADVLARF